MVNGFFDTVVVHYAEIGLKGKNRASFEKLLLKNMLSKLGSLVKSGARESGQIVLQITPGASLEKIKNVLSKVPGVAYFSFSKKTGLSINSIKKGVLDVARQQEFKTFKVNAKRHNKEYELTSMQLNSLLGETVIKKLRDKRVKMKDPDVTIKIEISNKHAYISLEDVKGIGGLPTNPRQKVVALISGGFDSPVAAYLMMKRGCEVILVHFHNQSQAREAVKDKITRLAKQLSKYQVRTKLYVVPFEKIQKELIKKTHSTIRMLVYRRLMLRIASRIASLNKARFLVVGDSLSQVASQTFENLAATYKNLDKHVLSPLIGFNKEEIIELAKRIGTYEISALPYGDCCTYFLPKHPALKASYELLRENESRFNVDALIDDAVKNAEIKEFK